MKNNLKLPVSTGNGSLLLGLVMVLNTVQAADKLEAIEVIFNGQTTIPKDSLVTALQNQGVSVGWFNLDLPAQVSRELSQGLPANPGQAKKIVQERLHSQGSAALSQRYQTAYQALIKSISYGLDRYPAIVFNKGQAVVYGVTDIKAALQAYQNWSASQ
ncbi:MAG: TIGR03757 family integrating conjugative element protein [Methylococcales bacterium]